VQASDYIGSAIAALIFFTLGIRVLRLGLRTRSAPERVLGLTFLFWGLFYVLRIISIAFHTRPDLQSQIAIAARIVDNLGSVGFGFFPLLVFRRGSAWAPWLATAIAFCLITGVAGSIWVGDPEGIKPLTNGWWWPEWFGEIASAIWIGVEGFHHYGMTRSRVRLGLCEPIVAHRYLLWGLVGLLWTLLDFLVVGQYVDFWATQTWSVALDNLVGCFEIGVLAMIWLTYFTPTRYLRRINASASSA
jgi:hypothetical protein